MGAKLNLIGQRFGKLTVIQETTFRKNNSVVWDCRCDCGNCLQLSTKELRSDGVSMCKNCGTSRKPKANLIASIVGEKYGFLRVLEKTSQTNKSGKILYKCVCDCGEIVYRDSTSLRRHSSPYCGKLGCPTQLKYHIGDIINNRKILGYKGFLNNDSKRFYYEVECQKCGRVYNALAQTIDKTSSCGCERSIGEENIRKLLIENNIPFQREVCFSELGKLRYDFAILDSDKNILRLIEFDGEQHYEGSVRETGWNTLQHFKVLTKNDNIKNAYANEQKIPLVRIPYWERYNITLDTIFSDRYLVK